MSRGIFDIVQFSIVTPGFNQGGFIRDRIGCVKAREDVDFEPIVLDACSTDETTSVLKTCRQVQWGSELDKGQADNINECFQKAERLASRSVRRALGR